jgi:hypothetical protein
MDNTDAGSQTGHIWWSDHPGIGAGGLTVPWWWSDCQGVFRPPEHSGFQEISQYFFWISEDSQNTQRFFKSELDEGVAHSEF